MLLDEVLYHTHTSWVAARVTCTGNMYGGRHHRVIPFNERTPLTNDKIFRPPLDSLGAAQPPLDTHLGQWSLPPGHDEIAHCAPRTVLVWITAGDRQTMSAVEGECISNEIAYFSCHY